MYVPNDIIHVCVKSINTKSHQLLLFILMFVFDLLYMYLPLSMQCILNTKVNITNFLLEGGKPVHTCGKHGTMYRCTGLKKNTEMSLVRRANRYILWCLLNHAV